VNTRKYLSLALSLVLSLSGAYAQDIGTTANVFSHITLAGADELAKTLSDPRVRIEDKREAVYRLGVLAKELYNNRQVPPSKLFNPILGVLTIQRDVPDHHILRLEACGALSQFVGLAESEKLIEPLGRVVQNREEHEEVRLSAARALGRFYKDSGLATDQLVVALNKELEAGPSSENVSVATAIIISIGALHDKRAFVPLMRVIQSRFPTYTKREAQRSLENIQWE